MLEGRTLVNHPWAETLLLRVAFDDARLSVHWQEESIVDNHSAAREGTEQHASSWRVSMGFLRRDVTLPPVAAH